MIRRMARLQGRVRVQNRRAPGVVVALFGLAFSMSGIPAFAQGFYQGKTLEIIVSANVSDSYDILGRLLGRHIGQYLPGNPTVIVRNMPGAGGIAAANHLANVAVEDGSVLGMLDQSIFETQLFSPGSLKADVRTMNWIGRVISNNAGLYAWHTAQVKRIEDAYTKELLVSSSGRSSQIRWTMLKNLVGVQFKLITGYRGASEGVLGMERGEVDAVSMPWAVFRVIHADWLRDKKVNVLLQTGLDRASDLPNVPLLLDLGRNDEERQILELFSQAERVGRSLTAPPDLPAQRLAMLRAAFAATLKDSGFLAEARSIELDLTPMMGEELQTMIEKSFDYSPAILEKAQSLIR
jgi:tripartite-type tricarboxylate transporter receptor subunit TctC